LRNDLHQEQMKSRSLEKRAAETPDLDCTRVFDFGGRHPNRAHADIDTTIAYDELEETRRNLGRKQSTVRSLEDDNLKLREELNQEKQKVLELKRGAHNRTMQWKAELQKITEEVESKQRLEEDVARLRDEMGRLVNELSLCMEREKNLKRDVDMLRRENQEAHAVTNEVRHQAAGKAEEMELLSSVVSGQLVAVEQELTQQLQKSSELVEQFISHAYEPLSVIRATCQHIATSGEAGPSPGTRVVPPLFDANAENSQTSLVKIVNVLRYSADVLEAHQQMHETRRVEHPQHRGEGKHRHR